MDTTLPYEQGQDTDDLSDLVGLLAGADPADAPEIAADLAQQLTEELESTAHSGPPEQLRAHFEQDTEVS